jgi:hypothetical protein
MLPSGQYTQNMGQIQRICQAIGENDLGPFWEDIKSVDWYNIEPIRTAMQRRSTVIGLAMCVIIVGVNVALAMTDIAWAIVIVIFAGCIGYIWGSFIFNKAYMKKINERTRQITLKATNYNNDLLKEKNLRLVVEVIGDWITLEYILTPVLVQGQAIPGLDFGSNLPPLPPIPPIQETWVPQMPANPPGYNQYAKPDHGGMQGPTHAIPNAQPMLPPSNHGGYQPPNVAMAPYYGDTYNIQPGNEYNGNQNNNGNRPPQTLVEQHGF